MDAKPSGRFLTGHSSGGWFALWAMVRYPALFGGSWPTSPDPVDFHDFIGVDLTAPGANMYRDASGATRPLMRNHDKVLQTIEQAARLETVLGHEGGQFRSFEWVFSPRRADGSPAFLFDRETGAVDPAVAAYWRDHYDVAHRIETDWSRLRKDLDGKLHLTVGSADSYYLVGAVHLLDAAFRQVGGRADFTYVPNATHSMSDVYAREGDRAALWKEMANAMYAIARPQPPAPDK
jgi:pimeloyl-ACP methyl ester carboxylesterase